MRPVENALAVVTALTSDERYRLAALLFDRREPACVTLAHAVVTAGVADEQPVADDLEVTT